MSSKRHVISLALFIAFIALGLASAPSTYDENEAPDCTVGTACGGACIDPADACDEDRENELREECYSNPCCVVGKECGDACIEVSDNCTLDDPPDPPDTSNCPTTSACGCSGFRQSECGGACCRWVVGDGCGCR